MESFQKPSRTASTPKGENSSPTLQATASCSTASISSTSSSSSSSPFKGSSGKRSPRSPTSKSVSEKEGPCGDEMEGRSTGSSEGEKELASPQPDELLEKKDDCPATIRPKTPQPQLNHQQPFFQKPHQPNFYNHNHHPNGRGGFGHPNGFNGFGGRGGFNQGFGGRKGNFPRAQGPRMYDNNFNNGFSRGKRATIPFPFVYPMINILNGKNHLERVFLIFV